ncbi:hypothetical protein OJAV_G00207240 [Oryzias javanicus]|uniref:Uncharacterized protein n=1 Tax=Oryzias javanicus TaxID=123683 RepID=A0A3S2PQJ7_ORYJA|nr:hypothetical protein OJAV_G00207240 [Oryzias javanicus]
MWFQVKLEDNLNFQFQNPGYHSRLRPLRIRSDVDRLGERRRRGGDATRRPGATCSSGLPPARTAAGFRVLLKSWQPHGREALKFQALQQAVGRCAGGPAQQEPV